jgi:hypothetical protein
MHCQKPAPAVSYYAPADPCCNPCPPVCTTRYVQRCYYQPVTCYQTKTYYEPVTTYRTSYYYEPVTSYRYSCYYDPCTCSYKQVACPTTCYQLRSQTCAVQSWVQRCCSVPVTTYQQSFYWEPVTTCCTPTSVAAPAADCPTQAPAAAATQPPAAVAEPGAGGGAGVRELPQRSSPEGSSGDRIAPQGGTTGPGGPSSRQLSPGGAAPYRQTAPPAVKFDRIAAVPGAQIQGQVVRDDQRPIPRAQVLFISSDRRANRKTVDADAAGKFKVTLASGSWLVYIQENQGKAVFQRKLDVGDYETRQVRLVSR